MFIFYISYFIVNLSNNLYPNRMFLSSSTIYLKIMIYTLSLIEVNEISFKNRL